MRKIIILLSFLGACSPQVTQSSLKTDLQNTKPAWLQAKPNADIYYNGIGHSTKGLNNDYLQEAKKSALEDLVSEIKVNVSSTSVLSQLDANKKFQESYEKIIQTVATDDIQEFEQVDSWQDQANYWVYYRLSKQRYKEIKDELKRNAVTKALDFFTKAKQAERSSDLVQALGLYFQGFKAIEKYLAEPIQLDFEGKSILLTNEIYTNIQSLLDKIQVTLTPSEVLANRRISESGINVLAKAILKENSKTIASLPLRAAFDKGAGEVYPEYVTDANGQSKILITKISARDLEQSVKASVNLAAFLGKDSSSITSLVIDKMNVPSANLLLKVERPLVYVTSSEKAFGTDRTSRQMTNRLQNFITNSGFEITPVKEKAVSRMTMPFSVDCLGG